MVKARDITLIAVMVTVISVFSQLAIPMPHGVPLTMQVFAVAFAGIILKPVHAIICITVYILAGAFGMPVFANLTGGIGKLAGPTGGFIFGFYFIIIFSAFLNNKHKFVKFVLMFTAVIIFHAVGIIHYSVIMKTDIIKSALIASVPYFPKDILSVIAANIFGNKIKKRLLRY